MKDLDKLDMVMQAYEYEQLEERPKFLQEFFDSTEGEDRLYFFLKVLEKYSFDVFPVLFKKKYGKSIMEVLCNC